MPLACFNAMHKEDHGKGRKQGTVLINVFFQAPSTLGKRVIFLTGCFAHQTSHTSTANPQRGWKGTAAGNQLAGLRLLAETKAGGIHHSIKGTHSGPPVPSSTAGKLHPNTSHRGGNPDLCPKDSTGQINRTKSTKGKG